MKSNITLRPVYMASVSGGKDSLFMLYLILNNLDKYPLDGVVHYELEIDYPFVKNVISKMKEMCNELNIPFYSVKPSRTWSELYNKYGFPSRKARWCNSQYKMDAKRQIEKFMKSQGKYIVNYIGFCADETSRFKYQIGKIAEGQTVVYPLAEEGINEGTILEWARTQEIFDNFYKVNERQGCMFCPMLQYKEMAYQMLTYPEVSRNFWFMVFTEWDRGINVLRGDKYTPDYIYKRVKDYWCLKVEQMLKGDNEDV